MGVTELESKRCSIARGNCLLKRGIGGKKRRQNTSSSVWSWRETTSPALFPPTETFYHTFVAETQTIFKLRIMLRAFSFCLQTSLNVQS